MLAADEVERVYPHGTATRLFSTGNEPMIPHTGDRDFDLALAQSLAKLSDILQVSPGFAFYDDYDGPNAYATPAVRLNGADGTVLFGTAFLLEQIKTSEAPEVAIITICAHEFGHIVQFKHNLQARVLNGDRSVKRAELHADFLAGYFVGMRRKERPSFPAAVAAMTQYNIGDNHFSSPQHHGTPKERGAAFVRGYETAFNENRLLAEALQISVNYASQL